VAWEYACTRPTVACAVCMYQTCWLLQPALGHEAAFTGPTGSPTQSMISLCMSAQLSPLLPAFGVLILPLLPALGGLTPLSPANGCCCCCCCCCTEALSHSSTGAGAGALQPLLLASPCAPCESLQLPLLLVSWLLLSKPLQGSGGLLLRVMYSSATCVLLLTTTARNAQG
jgi:hypothetical protein